MWGGDTEVVREEGAPGDFRVDRVKDVEEGVLLGGAEGRLLVGERRHGEES